MLESNQSIFRMFPIKSFPPQVFEQSLLLFGGEKDDGGLITFFLEVANPKIKRRGHRPQSSHGPNLKYHTHNSCTAQDHHADREDRVASCPSIRKKSIGASKVPLQ